MLPTLFEVSSAHEEGGERVYLASTVEFLKNEVGEVRAIRVAETEYVDGRRVPKAGTEREIPADLVLLALGFTGPERDALDGQLRVPFDDRGSLERDATYETSRAGRVRRRATPAAASRSSSGRSPRAARRPPPSTRTSRARPCCRSRSSPPIASISV